MSTAARAVSRFTGASAGAAGAVAFALALTGCTAGSESSSSGSNTNFVSGTGEISTVKAGHRTAAPELSGETVDGGKLSVADYKGKIVVLNIWGSWCSPCRAEAKNLVTVADDTKAKGVQFVGINTRDLQTAQAKAFEKKYAVSYPSLYDPTGKLILRFPKGSLNPQAIPTTIVLDRQGRIAVRALKALTEDELRKILDPLIAEK
ncbi:TlpA family protein disulfide reductase [Streptomyces sp. NBC_01262]|jgi:peroxiredoxin|uniref:TlpA family protein disulfide reductase n=1 Tax=Streptomyces sp. NBC_01262 TaxID=2903803 RepID=UPI002E3537AC|nr:TlpA disulfide reductase family protein [Streptomyces sp. NBC_01262]